MLRAPLEHHENPSGHTVAPPPRPMSSPTGGLKKPPIDSPSADSDDGASQTTNFHVGDGAGAGLDGGGAASGTPQPAEIQSTSPAAPVTSERDVPRGLDHLPFPGTPRASLACSKEHPQGINPSAPPHLTVLQQHCAFWDEDDDGVVWPLDTYRGFRRLGFEVFISVWSALLIHVALSWLTLDGWIPHPGFPLLLKNIHRGKHGSDSGTYDTEGRFVPQHFEEMFSKYDRGEKGGLSLGDVLRMTQGNWNAGDVAGWGAGQQLTGEVVHELMSVTAVCQRRDEDMRGIRVAAVVAKRQQFAAGKDVLNLSPGRVKATKIA